MWRIKTKPLKSIRRDKPTPVCESLEEGSPPESAVALAHADAAQHSLLVGHVFTQELANDVPAQTEAHHDQLRLGIGALDVAHHGCKFPRATWAGDIGHSQSVRCLFTGTLWGLCLLSNVSESVFHSEYSIWPHTEHYIIWGWNAILWPIEALWRLC